MKRGSTTFLKLAVFLIGIPILALCIILLPIFIRDIGSMRAEYARLLIPVVLVMYTSAIPFFYALYQALKLLNSIDKNKAFSEESVKSLKRIKYCAIAVGLLYTLGTIPSLFIIAELDDSPGLGAVALVIPFLSIVIAVFAAVLQRLLVEVIDIKRDNDLTIWGEIMAIIINMDVMLAKRKMSLTELSEKVGITMANLSILKNGKAKAIRFSTLDGICKALECQPGDIIEYRDEE